jgi:WD40 repeat protein
VQEFTTAPVSIGPERSALAAMEMPASPADDSSPVQSRLGHYNPDRGHAGCVMFSPNGRWLVVGEARASIRLLERATGNKRMILAPESADYITALAFSTKSHWLAAGYGAEDHDVHVWDLATDTEVRLPGQRRDPESRLRS